MQRLAFLPAVLLLAGCYDKAETPATIISDPPPVTMSLTELRRLYAGATIELKSSIVIAGHVTSDDRAGNFYRTLTIESDGTGIELMAGIDHLSNIYPEGYLLTVSLQGLAIGESRGILQVGRKPSVGSGYATDYIGSRAAIDRHIFRKTANKPRQPTITDIASLQPAMAGRFVRIDKLHFSPEDPDEPMTWSGNKRFIDTNDNILYVYTRPYADFANYTIPSGEVLLTGILQYERTADGLPKYTLKLRDEKDCWY